MWLTFKTKVILCGIGFLHDATSGVFKFKFPSLAGGSINELVSILPAGPLIEPFSAHKLAVDRGRSGLSRNLLHLHMERVIRKEVGLTNPVLSVRETRNLWDQSLYLFLAHHR